MLGRFASQPRLGRSGDSTFPVACVDYQGDYEVDYACLPTTHADYYVDSLPATHCAGVQACFTFIERVARAAGMPMSPSVTVRA